MAQAVTITVTANGSTWECAEGEALPRFLERLGQAPARVVVEHNHQALTPAELLQTRLNAGDTLEIVRIVAGG